MSRVVRSSKYRHVFGTAYPKEKCYDDLRITRNSWDSNYVCANTTFFGVIWEAGGGGSFAVIPHTSTGKFDAKFPLIQGHKGAVLDIDFNPFNDNLIGSASEDCYVKIWGIPEGGLKENMTTPLQTLSGHKRKVGTIQFNPVANNILSTTSADYSVKIWDIEKGANLFSLDGQHSDLILSSDWNRNGSLIVTSSKDKKVRVVDPRQDSVAGESELHGGVKGGRAIWLGSKDKIFSCGFTKQSEREFVILDPRDMSKPLVRQTVDSASGILMPFYDDDTNVLFLGGKGDGNIRYYEVVDEAPYIHYLTEYKSNVSQRGMCLMPKRALDIPTCEIARVLKVGVSKVEPISFQVPRKSDIFQDDIYPDCYAGEPSLTSEEWQKGQNANPKTVSLSTTFVPKKVVQEFKPTQVEEKVLSEKELQEEVEKLRKRVSYLESEIIKKDAKIKELTN